MRDRAQGKDWPASIEDEISMQTRPIQQHLRQSRGTGVMYGWQDHNIVMGLSTIYTVSESTDLVLLERRGPKTGTNASVSGENHRREIPIPPTTIITIWETLI